MFASISISGIAQVTIINSDVKAEQIIGQIIKNYYNDNRITQELDTTFLISIVKREIQPVIKFLTEYISKNDTILNEEKQLLYNAISLLTKREKEPPKATLKINTTVGADIYINGTYKGTTFYTQKDIEPETIIRIKIIKDNFRPYETSIICESGDNTISKYFFTKGHYLSFGSSILSSGYYGNIGLGYEYRYGVAGFNVSVGYDFGKTIWHGYFPHSKYPSLLIPTYPSYSNYIGGVNVNLGLKFYLGNTKEIAKDFYFNFLFLSFLGQFDDYHYVHYPLSNNTVGLEEERYSLFGIGLFFGYSPVWKISEKVSMGFNINIGTKTGIKFENWYWFPINWDLGLIIKFGG